MLLHRKVDIISLTICLLLTVGLRFPIGLSFWGNLGRVELLQALVDERMPEQEKGCHYDRAIEYLSSIPLAERTCTDSLNLAQAQGRRKICESVSTLHSSRSKCDPSDQVSVLRRGLICYEMGRYEEALSEWSVISSTAYSYFWMLANSSWGDGESDEAIAELRLATAIDPTASEPYYSIAGILWAVGGERGDLIESLETYLDLERMPSARRSFSLGRLMMLQGDSGAALVAFREAMILDPSFTLVRVFAAQLLIQHNECAEARVLLEDELRINPRSEALVRDLMVKCGYQTVQP
jgi:tetratricopeptide (TPR) repeat protein